MSASAANPATRDAVLSHAQIMRVLSGILLCILLAALDQTVVVPAVPAIATDLHAYGHLGWIVSAYLLTSTATTPIYGKLSDIYGRRALLLPAIALFVATSVLCAMSQTLLQLIIARALQGIGGGGLMSMAQAAIADVLAPRERARYQGYMAGVWGTASVAGPILGGWLTDDFSWRWIFWANLPVGAVAFLLCARALRILPVTRRVARIDYLGAALLAGCITALLLVLSWGGRSFPWLSVPVLGMLAVGVTLLVLLLWRERVAPDPLLPPRLFAIGEFVRGVAIAFLVTGCLFSATFLLPLYFQVVRGVSASAAGTLIVPLLAFSTAGAFLSGQVARRLGRARNVVACGLVVAAIGFVLLSLQSQRAGWPVLAPIMAVLGLGIGCCLPTTLVIVQNAAPRGDVGAATGGLLFLRSMGGAFGSTLVGAIVASSLTTHPTQALASFHLAFLTCAGLATLALVVCLGMRDVPLRSGQDAAPRPAIAE